jgi:hypothetical protein
VEGAVTALGYSSELATHPSREWLVGTGSKVDLCRVFGWEVDDSPQGSVQPFRINQPARREAHFPVAHTKPRCLIRTNCDFLALTVPPWTSS